MKRLSKLGALPDESRKAHGISFQERVQQLERQLKEMEKEKERELNALRKEKRELVHTTHTVRGIYDLLLLLLLLVDQNRDTTD